MCMMSYSLTLRTPHTLTVSGNASHEKTVSLKSETSFCSIATNGQTVRLSFAGNSLWHLL